MCVHIWVFTDAHIEFILFSLYLLRHGSSGLFISSLPYCTAYFCTKRGICGGWVGTEGKMREEKQGKLLHLDIVKDVSGVLSLVCSRILAEYGLDPGT